MDPALNAVFRDGGFGWTQALAAVATGGLVATGVDAINDGDVVRASTSLGLASGTAVAALTPDQAEGLTGTPLDYARYAGQENAMRLLRALGGRFMSEIPD